jgi:hypothetical protein
VDVQLRLANRLVVFAGALADELSGARQAGRTAELTLFVIVVSSVSRAIFTFKSSDEWFRMCSS